MAFARTEWNLYRAENYGLAWVAVGNLKSTPTAVAIADTDPAKVYVGTMDRGVLVSSDGHEWTTMNAGLNFVPGSRLKVNDLAVDVAQPDVLYVSTSFLYGTSEIHEAPAGVSLSTDGAQAWSPIHEASNMAVAELLPISGLTGGVYALTPDSRTPLALGNAPIITEVAAAQPAAQPAAASTNVLAWAIAGLAGLALTFAVVTDLLRSRRTVTEPDDGHPRVVALRLHGEHHLAVEHLAVELDDAVEVGPGSGCAHGSTSSRRMMASTGMDTQSGRLLSS